jgi:predicted DNA-binding transcriptional regulator AlpA
MHEQLEYLTTREVSEWVRVSCATLSRWRRDGHGPRVTWLAPGVPRYKRSDVERWLERAAA